MSFAIGSPFTRFVMEQQRLHPGATGEFTGLLSDLMVGAKIIARESSHAGLVDILGAAGGVNIQGEEVQKLDELSNRILVDIMGRTGRVAAMASEEVTDVIQVPRGYPMGNYLLCFDPLDGSSNIDANVNVGTIFSVLKRTSSSPEVGTEEFLQPGMEQVAAGYFIYGPSTIMVFTTGDGVHGFTLDPGVGEFLLSHPNIQTPARGKVYSINEGNSPWWTPGVKAYIDHLKVPSKPDGRKGYSLRYIGSLVADFHRTLLYGGIFLYPADTKDRTKPRGKLRLLYEANPLSMVMAHAGGRSTDGKINVLEIVPTELHQRVPLIIGSRDDVTEATEFLKDD
jgi:fructose-1,6-bisphosphatase I